MILLETGLAGIHDDNDSDLDFPADYDGAEGAVFLEDLLQLIECEDEFGEEEPEVYSSYSRFANDEDILLWGLSALCNSQLGRILAFDARHDDWALEVDDIETGRPIIDPQLRILILPRTAPSAAALSRSPDAKGEFLVNLVRGLRMIWHENTDVPHTAFDLEANDRIKWERLRAADFDLMTLLVAWEASQAGAGEFWRYLIGSSEFGDLAVPLARVAGRNPEIVENRSILTPLAMRWLSDPARLQDIDHRTIDGMDRILKAGPAERPFGARRLTEDDLLNLSLLPEEICYLESAAALILEDPHYTRIPDPINEAFLVQVLQEATTTRIHQVAFHDQGLARKIFPTAFQGADLPD
jgi:hypothetical protein